MRTTAFIALVISFTISACTSALVINRNQGEGSIQFNHESASVQEQLTARAVGGDIPVGQCERSTKKCVPRGPDES